MRTARRELLRFSLGMSSSDPPIALRKTTYLVNPYGLVNCYRGWSAARLRLKGGSDGQPSSSPKPASRPKPGTEQAVDLVEHQPGIVRLSRPGAFLAHSGRGSGRGRRR